MINRQRSPTRRCRNARTWYLYLFRWLINQLITGWHHPVVKGIIPILVQHLWLVNYYNLIYPNPMIEVHKPQFGDGSWCHPHVLLVSCPYSYSLNLKGDIIPTTSSWVLRSTTYWSTRGTKPKWLRPSPKWCARYPYLGMVGGMNMGKQGWLRMGIESVCKSLFLAFKFIETHLFFGGFGASVWGFWIEFELCCGTCSGNQAIWPNVAYQGDSGCARNGFLVVLGPYSGGDLWFMATAFRTDEPIASAAVFFGSQGPRIQHGAQRHGGVSRGASGRPRKDPGETSQEIGLPEIKGFFPQENRLQMVHGIHIYVIFDPNG